MPPKGRPRRKSVAPPIKATKGEVEQPHNTDVVPGPSSSETLLSSPPPPPPPPQPTPDKSNDDVVLCSSSETLTSPVKEDNIVVNGGDVPVIAKCTTVDDDKDVKKNDDEVSVGKPKKKVVKKTVKVIKKVIKKVPKKSVKQGINSNNGAVDKDCGNLDAISNSMNSNVVNEEELECGGSASAEIKVENLQSDVLVCGKEKVEEKKVEVDEKEVQGESVAIKGSKFMEVENSGQNNGENVDWGKEGKGSNGEERQRQCQTGDEDLGSGEGKKGEGECGKGEQQLGGGKGSEEEEREVEVEVGEGKLFRGELEAMERKKRRKKEIFIGRLDKDVKEEDVRKVFDEAGEIVDLRLLMNSKTGKKFAFVRYASAEGAQRALEKFAKVEICGKECGATPVEGNDTIFLGNIDRKWKDKDVVQLLRKIGIGKIDNVTVMVDPNNTECNRGFAFIEFETINDAQVAYTKLKEKVVLGKNPNLKVSWAEPLKELDEKEMLKVKTVYAEFIPSSWDEEKVKDTFKRFGEIDDIVLARNLRTSKRRDFAFVSYKTRAAAIKCIESFGHDLRDEDGAKMNVKVSLAKPKSKSKKIPATKPSAKETPRANPDASHSKARPSEPRNRGQPNVLHHGIRIPEVSSTNVELVRLLREQATWRPPHTSLSNIPMDIHPLSGRKRQFSELEPDPLYEDLNRYRHSRLDASYSAASSSHNVLHPTGLTNAKAYHHQHSGYPFGSVYEARNFASNAEIRGKPHESRFPYRRY